MQKEIEKIPFNKPFLTGKELEYIYEAVQSGKISGDGNFSKRCQEFLERRYNFPKCLLTTSCTDALEMTALLLNIEEGDEIIMPSFTFVSTANAFILRKAKIVFADSAPDHPNIDADKIESLITHRTKAIVLVHYAGVACDMDKIMSIAHRHNVTVIEDAAQAINSFYKGRALGSFGCLSAMSFHETKNINCGEGGLLIITQRNLVERAEIIREKGTNRSAFFRGEIDKYSWVDIGSSFLPSDLNAAYLYAQLQHIDMVQHRRLAIYDLYTAHLKALAHQGHFKLPVIPGYATNTGHIFYLVCSTEIERAALINELKESKVMATFHYQSLHQSPYFRAIHDGRALENSDRYSACLVRLPLYYELADEQVIRIAELIAKFFSR